MNMDVERLNALGKEIGLKGKYLQDFLCDERSAYRKELDRQRKERDRQREIELEERDRQREIEERDKVRQHELEMAKVKLEESRNLSMVSENSSNPPQTKFKIAKLPPFDDSKDSVDAYLIRFEKYHEAMKTDKGDWAIYLSALLKGKALEVYSRLSSFEASNYEVLKSALLRRY